MGAPKLKKFPKAPKAGASLASLENYKKKCDAVSKENIAKTNAYKAAEKKRKDLIEGAKKAKEKSAKAKA